MTSQISAAVWLIYHENKMFSSFSKNNVYNSVQ